MFGSEVHYWKPINIAVATLLVLTAILISSNVSNNIMFLKVGFVF